MLAKTSSLDGNVPDHSWSALLLIDVINDLNFPDGKKLLTGALPTAKRLVDFKRSAKQAAQPLYPIVILC